MKRHVLFGAFLLALTLLGGCSKSDSSPEPPNPPPTSFVLSNLEYNPKQVALKATSYTVGIAGSITFTGAQGGIASIRLVSPQGLDLTIPVQGGSGMTSGTLSLLLELETPTQPASFSFEVWAVDEKNRSSNKLSGTVSFIIDDSAITWRNYVLSPFGILNKAIWANNLFVAIGEGGRIMTSPNGEIWTDRESKTNANLRSICWSGNQFIAVGPGPTIISSPNGIDWNVRKQENTSMKHLSGVCWTGSQFIAVGGQYTTLAHGLIMTSADGINWNEQPPIILRGELKSVAWSGNKAVTVGEVAIEAPTGGFNMEPLILSSIDGLNWTQQSVSMTNKVPLIEVNWFKDKFIALGGFGLQGPGMNQGVTIISSVDGNAWNTVSTLPANFSMKTMIQVGNKYVGAGIGIHTSPDLINWTTRYPMSASDYSINGLAWNGYSYGAVGKLTEILVSP
ncbi:hypothetical protein KJS94_09710 [Flavihumibacter rivuli]|uniref:hypothetical protein n=1 Tax=Flavihumibacter rivuli TaxID=2838156 RepID=UPI001BDE74C3|nr:hypothetical protein [Flavihumibacter rivuli]ULQ54913.1 hypothetical protein KJS94_09710 [Flavihumibacter rivuli]